MTQKTGIIRFACNKKAGKNGQNQFCPSTKTAVERAGTIMVVRYKNGVFVDISKKIGGILAKSTVCRLLKRYNLFG